MKRPQLILHIGIQKTGSTSIQRALESNIKLLNSEMIYYPLEFVNNIFGKELNTLINNELLYYAKYGEGKVVEEQRKKTERFVSKAIKKFFRSKCEKMIVSDESFYPRWDIIEFYEDISNIRQNEKDGVDNIFGFYVFCEDLYKEKLKRLKQLFKDFDIEIICYLRRQDLQFESHYNQVIKAMTLLPIFEKNKIYLEEFKELYGFPFHELTSSDYPRFFYDFLVYRYRNLCYYETLSVWADVFGKESILIKPFEQRLFKNGLVEDFFVDVFNIDKNKLVDNGQRHLYKRISRDLVEYIITLNNIPKRVHTETLEKISLKLNNICMYHHYFSTNDRMQLLNYFKEGNEKIARKFLNREDGILFYEDIDTKQEAYPGLSIETKLFLDKEFEQFFKRSYRICFIIQIFIEVKKRVQNYLITNKNLKIIGKIKVYLYSIVIMCGKTIKRFSIG